MMYAKTAGAKLTKAFPSRKYLLSHLKDNKKNNGFWYNISWRSDLTYDFIREFKDHLYWAPLCSNGKLVFTDEFLDEFDDYIRWDKISENKVFDDEFIRRYASKLNFISMSRNQKLSEEIMNEYESSLDWSYVSLFQKMSDQFIKKHRDRLNIELMTCNRHVPKKFKKLMSDLIVKKKIRDRNWCYITSKEYDKGVQLMNSLKEVDKYFENVA